MIPRGRIAISHALGSMQTVALRSNLLKRGSQQWNKLSRVDGERSRVFFLEISDIKLSSLPGRQAFLQQVGEVQGICCKLEGFFGQYSGSLVMSMTVL